MILYKILKAPPLQRIVRAFRAVSILLVGIVSLDGTQGGSLLINDFESVNNDISIIRNKLDALIWQTSFAEEAQEDDSVPAHESARRLFNPVLFLNTQAKRLLSDIEELQDIFEYGEGPSLQDAHSIAFVCENLHLLDSASSIGSILSQDDNSLLGVINACIRKIELDEFFDEISIAGSQLIPQIVACPDRFHRLQKSALLDIVGQQLKPRKLTYETLLEAFEYLDSFLPSVWPILPKSVAVECCSLIIGENGIRPLAKELTSCTYEQALKIVGFRINSSSKDTIWGKMNCLFEIITNTISNIVSAKFMPLLQCINAQQALIDEERLDLLHERVVGALGMITADEHYKLPLEYFAHEWFGGGITEKAVYLWQLPQSSKHELTDFLRLSMLEILEGVESSLLRCTTQQLLNLLQDEKPSVHSLCVEAYNVLSSLDSAEVDEIKQLLGSPDDALSPDFGLSFASQMLGELPLEEENDVGAQPLAGQHTIFALLNETVKVLRDRPLFLSNEAFLKLVKLISDPSDTTTLKTQRMLFPAVSLLSEAAQQQKSYLPTFFEFMSEIIGAGPEQLYLYNSLFFLLYSILEVVWPDFLSLEFVGNERLLKLNEQSSQSIFADSDGLQKVLYEGVADQLLRIKEESDARAQEAGSDWLYDDQQASAKKVSFQIGEIGSHGFLNDLKECFSFLQNTPQIYNKQQAMVFYACVALIKNAIADFQRIEQPAQNEINKFLITVGAAIHKMLYWKQCKGCEGGARVMHLAYNLVNTIQKKLHSIESDLTNTFQEDILRQLSRAIRNLDDFLTASLTEAAQAGVESSSPKCFVGGQKLSTVEALLKDVYYAAMCGIEGTQGEDDSFLSQNYGNLPLAPALGRVGCALFPMLLFDLSVAIHKLADVINIPPSYGWSFDEIAEISSSLEHLYPFLQRNLTDYCPNCADVPLQVFQESLVALISKADLFHVLMKDDFYSSFADNLGLVIGTLRQISSIATNTSSNITSSIAAKLQLVPAFREIITSLAGKTRAISKDVEQFASDPAFSENVISMLKSIFSTSKDICMLFTQLDSVVFLLRQKISPEEIDEWCHGKPEQAELSSDAIAALNALLVPIGAGEGVAVDPSVGNFQQMFYEMNESLRGMADFWLYFWQFISDTRGNTTDWWLVYSCEEIAGASAALRDVCKNVSLPKSIASSINPIDIVNLSDIAWYTSTLYEDIKTGCVGKFLALVSSAAAVFSRLKESIVKIPEDDILHDRAKTNDLLLRVADKLGDFCELMKTNLSVNYLDHYKKITNSETLFDTIATFDSVADKSRIVCKHVLCEESLWQAIELINVLDRIVSEHIGTLCSCTPGTCPHTCCEENSFYDYDGLDYHSSQRDNPAHHLGYYCQPSYTVLPFEKSVRSVAESLQAIAEYCENIVDSEIILPICNGLGTTALSRIMSSCQDLAVVSQEIVSIFNDGKFCLFNDFPVEEQSCLSGMSELFSLIAYYVQKIIDIFQTKALCSQEKFEVLDGICVFCEYFVNTSLQQLLGEIWRCGTEHEKVINAPSGGTAEANSLLGSLLSIGDVLLGISGAVQQLEAFFITSKAKQPCIRDLEMHLREVAAALGVEEVALQQGDNLACLSKMADAARALKEMVSLYKSESIVILPTAITSALKDLGEKLLILSESFSNLGDNVFEATIPCAEDLPRARDLLKDISYSLKETGIATQLFVEQVDERIFDFWYRNFIEEQISQFTMPSFDSPVEWLKSAIIRNDNSLRDLSKIARAFVPGLNIDCCVRTGIHAKPMEDPVGIMI
ncbi:MAG: hypothetical protein LBF72_00035 [Holosporales bacterium]|jgi:hypothetical protein|nr:hypothetical protein [Holosporales bacterium]